MINCKNVENAYKIRTQGPGGKRSKNLTRRFRKDDESNLCFIVNLEIELTNNLIKLIIRFVVLNRVDIQGTYSEVERN